MRNSIFIGREITDETRNWLQNNRVLFIDKPLIKIEYNLPDFSFFNGLKEEALSWVVTSKHAAHWLKNYYTQIGFYPNDTIFCLSQKQRDVLSGISQEILISNEKNANSLVQLVNEKRIGKSVIYLKGSKSLNILQTEIDSVNIQLFETEVYRNLPVIQKLNAHFDAYLFFSPSAIESFIAAGNTIPGSAQIFTIGKTTANKAKQFFMNQVFESPIQEEISFIAFAAKQLKIVQPSNIYLYE